MRGVISGREAALVVVLLVAVVWVSVGEAETAASSRSGEEWQAEGEALLKEGKYDDAYVSLSNCLEVDEGNVRCQLKRAVAQQFRGKLTSALRDLGGVLAAEPDNVAALLRRGKLYKQLGRWQRAEDDFQRVLDLDGGNVVASREGRSAGTGRQQQEKAERYLAVVGEEEGGKRQNMQQGKVHLRKALELAPSSEDLLALEAEVALEEGELEVALGSAAKALKTNPKSLRAILVRAKAMFASGDRASAATYLKQAVRLDPENKEVSGLFQRVKRYNKKAAAAEEDVAAGRWQEALEQYEGALALFSEHADAAKAQEGRCRCLVELKRPKEAIGACNAALTRDPSLLEALLWRGDANMQLEDYATACRDFLAAKQKAPNDRTVLRRAQDCENKKRAASRKDYYKLLGVSKDATPKDIKKAFRTKALEFHPDKCPQEERDVCERKFQDINEANDILLDEEKRARYDRGEDPNEPANSMHHGFHGNSPFTFTFNMGGAGGGPGGGGGGGFPGFQGFPGFGGGGGAGGAGGPRFRFRQQ